MSVFSFVDQVSGFIRVSVSGIGIYMSLSVCLISVMVPSTDFGGRVCIHFES